MKMRERIPTWCLILYLAAFIIHFSPQDEESVQRSNLSIYHLGDQYLETLRGTVTNRSVENMCEYFKRCSPAAIWEASISKIHTSSRLDMDPEFLSSAKTAEILRMVSPRLANSIRFLPRDWQTIRRVVDKGFQRYKYIRRHGADMVDFVDHRTAADGIGESETGNDDGSNIPQPLKIIVFGGSVTRGINCITAIRGLNNEKCAWPNRLETLVNTLVGGPLIQVRNLAIGGSNTKTAQAILEYDLLSEEDLDFDVVINSYSTNDMHILTQREAEQENVSLGDKVFEMAQAFARTLYSRRNQKCSGVTNAAPLLLWLDDYLGNEQREILKTTELSQRIQVLASYYGFGFVSYSDVVRDWVYYDTKEHLFSPKEWYDNQSQVMQREVHPGEGMHMTTSWIVAYYFLNLASTYCGFEAWNIPSMEQTAVQYDEKLDPEISSIRNSERIEGRPEASPAGLPPKLTPDLRLDDVSHLWHNSKQTTEWDCSLPKRCGFSWVSGIYSDASLSSMERKREVYDRFQPYVVNNHTWTLVSGHGGKEKLGWVPGAPADPLILEFGDISHPIHRVTMFYMKSYGFKWQNSQVGVHVDAVNEETHEQVSLASKTLYGLHGKETSEMYTDEVKFETPHVGKIRITLNLVGGSTFKLLGLAICR